MPKIRNLGFRLEARQDSPFEADLMIYDDIGEYEDWISGKLKGYGPKKLTEDLAQCTASVINVHINSMGGNIFDGISVLNILKGCGKEISVYIEGVAASAASMIAMAGKSVKMYQTSQMMVHNCWTYAIGNSKELRKTADDMDKIMEGAKLSYLSKAGGKLTAEKLDELLEAESYLTAAECLELGLCDEIVDAPEPEASEDPEEHQEKEDAEVNAKTEPVIMTETHDHWFF